MPRKRQMIKISLIKGGQREVEAYKIIGQLAVIQCLGFVGGPDHTDWQVTHIPTGWRITGCIKSRARAIRIAKALQFLDWNFRSPKSRKVKAMASKVEWAINLTT